MLDSPQLVGSIGSLFRYPVKSMLGEMLDQADVTPTGFLGDRAYALWDIESQRIVSAKNPKKWSKMLDFQAEFMTSPELNRPLPPVQLTLPGGDIISSQSDQLESILSALLGRTLQFLTRSPQGASLDHYWPDVEGTPQREVTTELFLPSGTFFDSCFIHLLTTATLNRYQDLCPESQFAVSRFRPNIVIEPTTPTPAFLENDWVGRRLAIGSQVQLSIDTACPRCVVTTLAQSDLPQDLNILRATVQHNQMIAGIRASVLQPGTIQVKDPVWVF